MDITICSTFRQSARYINRYITQVEDLIIHGTFRKYHFNFVLGYGDSTDHTPSILYEKVVNNLDAIFVECSHGGPSYGSIVNPDRFKQLSFVWNRVLACIPPRSSVVILLESDLIWYPHTLLKLIAHTVSYPAIAPLIFHRDGIDEPYRKFYDTFAFRRNEVNFTNDPPYHPDLNGEILQVDSAGSCIALWGDIARKLTVPEEDVVVGMCRQIYDMGHSVYCDPHLIVEHP